MLTIQLGVGVGMGVGVGIGIGIEEAFVRFRAHAYAHERRLVDVVARRLRFPPPAQIRSRAATTLMAALAALNTPRRMNCALPAPSWRG